MRFFKVVPEIKNDCMILGRFDVCQRLPYFVYKKMNYCLTREFYARVLFSS